MGGLLGVVQGPGKFKMTRCLYRIVKLYTTNSRVLRGELGGTGVVLYQNADAKQQGGFRILGKIRLQLASV